VLGWLVMLRDRRHFGRVTIAAALGSGLLSWTLGAPGSIHVGASGVIFGKAFFRWVCPIGFIMEIVTGLGGPDSTFQGMYQYHKLGCPIAWISGVLNKFSLFKVRMDASACSKCGLCDKSCYLATLEPTTYSLFKKDKERPGDVYACSRCLA